ncbi:hypothetical protein G6F31_013975 [Rhizopus arrhizus]|nr:hypothetical protein G6F31_013975 [Rhizopus arrhizus]
MAVRMQQRIGPLAAGVIADLQLVSMLTLRQAGALPGPGGCVRHVAPRPGQLQAGRPGAEVRPASAPAGEGRRCRGLRTLRQRHRIGVAVAVGRAGCHDGEAMHVNFPELMYQIPFF